MRREAQDRTFRRGRLARLVVIALGLLITGGLYAGLAPSASGSGGTSRSTVAQGRELFLVGCASCHGKNGEGVVTRGEGHYGPALAGVGAAAVDFQVGTGRMPLARPGGEAVRKPVVYSPTEISALAAYVASLGPGPSVPERTAYDPGGLSNDQVVEGGEFFRTNCTACHNYAGAGGALPGGRFAPNLTGTSPKHVYEAMLTGPGQMPVFADSVATPQQKREVIGYLASMRTTPHYGGSNLGSLGPVSEGLIAWVVGIGAAVTFAVWIASHSTRSNRRRNHG